MKYYNSSAFRGFVGFVAFIDIGSAARAYIEKRSFLGDHSDSNQIHEGNLGTLSQFEFDLTFN